jgi:hypothetical protein
MTETLKERARLIRERELVRAWEYRQRDYSYGVWFKLRRILTDADRIFIIDEEEADRLEKEGYAAESVGRELAPPKRIFKLTPAEAARIRSGREIPVRLSADFLYAGSLVLTPLMTDRPPGSWNITGRRGPRPYDWPNNVSPGGRGKEKVLC